MDESPEDETWNEWGANQRDLFFLDANRNYITHFNITSWNENQISDQIKDLLPD